MTSSTIIKFLFIIAISGLSGGRRRSAQVSSSSSRSSSASSQLVDFDCPEEFGYYSHPTDCTQYYVCVFGGALLESCTGGLMYSHELQTCDWPRNVGCGGSPAPAPAPREEVRVRVQPVVQTQVLQQPRHRPIPKHDLYTEEEELGPAEEIETDRQQRVYRGQPSTIGQVQSDRDAISTHSNAIPVSSSGRENSKLSVISYGAQQQYNRASLSPQTYSEPATSAPVRSYNNTQYVSQYDPYYTQYEEQGNIYKDIVDYSQLSDGVESYSRGRDKKPQIDDNRGYSKSKYTTQQDIYQPITQHDYQSYTVQDADELEYNRQPVQTKIYNRSDERRKDEEGGGVQQTRLVTLNAQLSNVGSGSKPQTDRTNSARDIDQPRKPVRIITSKSLISDEQRSIISQTPRPFLRPEQTDTETRARELQDGFRQGLQINRLQTVSESLDNYYSYEPESRQSRITETPVRKSSEGKGFAIRGRVQEEDDEDVRPRQRTEAVRTTTEYVTPKRTVFYETIPEVRQTTRSTVRTTEKSRVPFRFIVSPNRGDQEAQIRIVKTEEPRSSPKKYEPATQYTPRYYTRSEQSEAKPIKYDVTTEYTLRYQPSTAERQAINQLSSRSNPTTTEYVLKYQNERKTNQPLRNYETSTEYQLKYQPSQERWETTTEYVLRYQQQNKNEENVRYVTKKPETTTEYNLRYQLNQDQRSQRVTPKKYVSEYSRNSELSSNRYQEEKTTTEYVPKYISLNDRQTDSLQNIKSKTIDSFTLNRPSYLKPKFELTPIVNNSLSQIECTDCEKPIVRVKPASYDTQSTPGFTRGNGRNRGSATYTVSPNEAEPTILNNRGTPAVSRNRPTLKPSTSIVSKAAEFVDIYRFPPYRPEPIYPTPTPDKTAAKCRKDVCLLPDCYCGGKDVPGDLSPEQTPQIVLLTFDDSVNDLNKGLYADLFEKGRTNPNGCPISATFYVSHEWTDYSQVQNLYSAGHEIASHSVSHSFGEQFSQKKWTREIAGQREILAAYGGVKQEDIRGMRAPFLAVGGNKMFKMLYDSNFTYDSSMPVYENRPPSWPYTLDYKVFHDCMIPPCPTKSYPGVWEVPMVMWQDLNGGRCSMGDACSNPPTSDGVYKMLIKNFERHFTSNRSPFGLFYHAAWFTQPHHKEGFIAFLDTITNMPEVWVVTNWQMIQWVRDPTPISRLNSFAPFQCNYQDRPKKCTNPKVCNLWHKSGVRYMRTCQACPEIYPWTGKTGVRNSRVDNEVFQE